MGLFKGATFSLAHSLDQMLSLRPHNRFEDLEGVYLVGGGTHPGSGLPVIYQSAKISSRCWPKTSGTARRELGAARPPPRLGRDDPGDHLMLRTAERHGAAERARRGAAPRGARNAARSAGASGRCASGLR